MSSFHRNLALSLSALLALIALASEPVGSLLATRSKTLGRALDLARSRALTEVDRDALTEGYYEGLMGEPERRASVGSGMVSRLTRPSRSAPPAKRETLDRIGAVQSHPFLQWRLKPGLELSFKGAPLITNSRGQRDQDYELEKPAATFRIALVGSSLSMGGGVAMEETFEAVFERMLNDRARRSDIQRYEVINFSVAGYRLTQHVYVIAEVVPDYEPDLILLVVNNLAVAKSWSKHLVELIATGEDLRYPVFRELAAREQLTSLDTRDALTDRLAPSQDEVNLACIRFIQSRAQQMDARLAVVLLAPAGSEDMMRRRFENLSLGAVELGIPVIDLLDSFEGFENPESLWLQPWDDHLNVLGHRLVAETLYRKARDSGILPVLRD